MSNRQYNQDIILDRTNPILAGHVSVGSSRFDQRGTDLSTLQTPRPLVDLFGPVHVSSETGQLKRVIIGHPCEKNYDPSRANPICLASRKTLSGEVEPVSLDTAKQQFAFFRRVLEAHGVKVASPTAIEGAFDQIFTRDPYGVIDGSVVPANMALTERKPEPKAIGGMLKYLHSCKIANIKVAPLIERETGQRINFEFGDICVHGKYMFVGQSERTNAAGFRWLQKTFGYKYETIAVHLRKPGPDEEALHLDCAMNFVGSIKRSILIWHPKSLVDPEQLFRVIGRNHLKVEVNDREQANYATNVLSINPENVIVSAGSRRVSEQVDQLGVRTHTVDFRAAETLGGSVRCCSCPLEREAEY